MRTLMMILILMSSMGCQAQLLKWQRNRTVEHSGRIESYQGHVNLSIAGEVSELDLWFQRPNHFLVVTKAGEIVRNDGSTMEMYDPKTRLHTVFKNLPLIDESASQRLIGDLFDQSMSAFTFTLGGFGKVAGRSVIELRLKPKGASVVQKATYQIFEFSFPLKTIVQFPEGQSAQYEFSTISFNEKFELPKAQIPKDVLKIEWDFNKTSPLEPSVANVPQNLKHEKTLKHDPGMVLNYYRNGAEYLSVMRYPNLGNPPAKKGIQIKVGKNNGFLFPGPVSSTLIVSVGNTTYLYSSNLLVDDLIAFASASK